LVLRLQLTWFNTWSKRLSNSHLNRLRNLPGPNEQIFASADRDQTLLDLYFKLVRCAAVLNHIRSTRVGYGSAWATLGFSRCC
jgi:hypothetical protein